ncbi:MAG TPA: hypothetical protein VGO78_06180 [Acidimicrobiales bacterium]|nr:hypothetical protein [Acidimicrobiales bacterium]
MRGTVEGSEARPETDDEGWDQPGGRGRRPERWLIAALVMVVLLAIALLGFQSGASEDDDTAERASDEQAATTAPPPAAPATTQAPAQPAAVTPGPSPEPAGDTLEDGRHPVYVTAVGGSGATVQFDLVQWLTGDAADQYVEDHPDEYPGMYEEEGGFPYDSLVVNDNPRLRTLPVADGANAVVLYGKAADDWAIERRTIPVGDLPGYFAAHDTGDGPHLSSSVVWLSVEDGRIVSMEEQFQS